MEQSGQKILENENESQEESPELERLSERITTNTDEDIYYPAEEEVPEAQASQNEEVEEAEEQEDQDIYFTE